MNKSNSKLLDVEGFLNTYSYKIPTKQLKLVNDRSWFPIHENSELAKECAYLIGKIMGDGHLDKNFSSFFVGQEEELKNLKKIIKMAFRIEENRFSIKYRKAKGISYRLSVGDTLLGRLLFSLGAPPRNKTKQAFLVPDWICNSKENSKMFLNALLEDELTTIKIAKKYHSNQPKLKMAKKEELITNLYAFLLQVREMIESFGVACGRLSKPARSNGTDSIEIYFDIYGNKANIIRFAKNIGYRIHPEKMNYLNDCVKILEKTLYHRKPVIESEKIVHLRKKGYSIREISRIVGLNRTSVHRVVRSHSVNN